MANAPKNQFETPTPEQQQVPYEAQPVQQQYFSQPNAAPVQYVVAQQSLKGLRGWLLFFTVISGFMALYYVSAVVTTFAHFTTDKLSDAIFTPLLLAGAIAAVVLTALEKRMAKYAFIIFYIVAYIYQVINLAMHSRSGEMLMTSVLTGGIWVLFIILYFVSSKRVKETLVK